MDAATEINRLVGSEIGLEEMDAAGSYEQLCAKIATAVASEIRRGVMRRLRVIAQLIYLGISGQYWSSDRFCAYWTTCLIGSGFLDV